MKTFDIKTTINEVTYEDEYELKIKEESSKTVIKMTTDELLDLYNETKHAVETNIC